MDFEPRRWTDELTAVGRPRGWRSAPLVAVLFGVALGVAACGAGSVHPNAHAGSRSTPSTRPPTTTSTAPRTSTTTTLSPQLAGTTTTTTSIGASGPSSSSSSGTTTWAQCMQQHGVDVPSGPPTGASSGAPSPVAGSYNPNSPTTQAAEQACQQYASAKPVS
jgi:hypothetical protein